jgi:hypothetical protein
MTNPANELIATFKRNAEFPKCPNEEAAWKLAATELAAIVPEIERLARLDEAIHGKNLCVHNAEPINHLLFAAFDERIAALTQPVPATEPICVQCGKPFSDKRQHEWREWGPLAHVPVPAKEESEPK